MRALLENDASMVVWWGTRTECVSALQRRRREAAAARTAVRDALHLVEVLAQEWTEVAPTEVVRKRAERLLAVHAIRAADALQLAAALVWARNDPSGHCFVCLDERLREAAGREGFQVLPVR
ncbi:MAG: PIN domain-containing protein [Planctomycetes bacterium]|nr:PIN domain-containing protein [Planctomycetota bacterium]